MGIHGDDVVRVIRAALVRADTCNMQSAVRSTPNEAADGWKIRDGRLEWDAVGRDWFRGFRITVEAIPVESVGEVDRAADDGSFQIEEAS
jgi:hypothetical protein